MSNPIRIPPSEWVVLEVLWNESPLSAAEISERLPDSLLEEGGWNTKTVRAFLDRLIRKNAVSRRKIHGMFVFKPIIKRDESLQYESQSFLERFFQGSPLTMISHLIENESLSEADITRLKLMLEDRGQRTEDRK